MSITLHILCHLKKAHTFICQNSKSQFIKTNFSKVQSYVQYLKTYFRLSAAVSKCSATDIAWMHVVQHSVKMIHPYSWRKINNSIREALIISIQQNINEKCKHQKHACSNRYAEMLLKLQWHSIHHYRVQKLIVAIS